MSQHLQKIERIQIQTLLDTGNSIDDIAIYLNRHRSTIYREMKRSGVNVKIMKQIYITNLREKTWEEK